MFRIGEFSRLSQTSVKTLRFYEAETLFAPAHVDPDSGYRYYSADQIIELEQILHLRTMGFSLRQIRDLKRGDSGRLRAMLLDKRHDGALIYMSYRGVRHASADVSARLARGEKVNPREYYLRIASFFETSTPKYSWLNNLVAVGVGERLPDGVVYKVFEIL